jgi:hypothetical protein
MSSSSRLRRILAASACGTMAAGLAWLPAGPASAAVKFQFAANATAEVSSSSCSLTSGDANVSSQTPILTHGKRNRSVAMDATFTATADSTDTVHATGHISGTAAVSKKGPNLSKATVTGTGAVSLHNSKGTNTVCDPSASVSSGVEMLFSEGAKGWLYVQRSTVAKAGVSEVIVETSAGKAVVFEIYQGGASKASTRAFVKPGKFTAAMAVGATAGQTIILKSPPRNSVSMVFRKAGSALTGTKGPGRAYVEFPGSVSCGAHRATLRWKSSAGRAAAGSFFVNGKQKASDGTPKGGEKIVLKHLKSKADLKVTAKVRLTSGGTATATRQYVPCQG